MADTAVEVANQALALIGANTISTFVGTGTEQIAATHLYQPTVDAALTSHRWRFASGKKQLSILVATPADDWDSAFQIPTDPPVLLINSISVLDHTIEYDRFEDHIYCDATSDDTVIMDYIYSRDEIDWPAYFTKAIVFELAAVFAAAITQDSFLAAHFTEQANMEYSKARFADSSSQTARNLNTRGTHSLISRRFGGSR
jgi:hypothetical protein